MKRKLLKEKQSFKELLHKKQINIQRLKKLKKLIVTSQKVDFIYLLIFVLVKSLIFTQLMHILAVMLYKIHCY